MLEKKKEKNTPGARRVSPVRWKSNIKELWRKGFLEKMSFQPGVEE